MALISSNHDMKGYADAIHAVWPLPRYDQYLVTAMVVELSAVAS